MFLPYSAECAAEGSIQRVTVYGEVDVATAPLLRNTLDTCSKDAEVRTLITDMTGVTFCDSTGLSVLVTTNNKCKEQGVKFVLVLPPEHRVRTILNLTGLNRVLEVRET